MGALVRTCKGAHDAALAFGLPFISGKDSLNNEFSMSEEEAARLGLPARIAIPGTLLISSLGIVWDVHKCVTMDFKEPESRLVLASAPLDDVGLDAARALHHRVADLIASGKVLAAHDVSDGGLAVAIAEMCIASKLGADVVLEGDTYRASVFAPLPTTYVLEMSTSAAKESGLPIIGQVVKRERLTLSSGAQGEIDLAIADLASAWDAPLKDGGGR